MTRATRLCMVRAGRMPAASGSPARAECHRARCRPGPCPSSRYPATPRPRFAAWISGGRRPYARSARRPPRRRPPARAKTDRREHRRSRSAWRARRCAIVVPRFDSGARSAQRVRGDTEAIEPGINLDMDRIRRIAHRCRGRGDLLQWAIPHRCVGIRSPATRSSTSSSRDRAEDQDREHRDARPPQRDPLRHRRDKQPRSRHRPSAARATGTAP